MQNFQFFYTLGSSMTWTPLGCPVGSRSCHFQQSHTSRKFATLTSQYTANLCWAESSSSHSKEVQSQKNTSTNANEQFSDSALVSETVRIQHKLLVNFADKTVIGVACLHCNCSNVPGMRDPGASCKMNISCSKCSADSWALIDYLAMCW